MQLFSDEDLPSLLSQSQIHSCGECRLYRGCISPKMPPTGDGEKGILVIAEAPGEREDRKNEQLIGKCGKWFRKELKTLGVDLDRDCRKTNAVICRPPDNRTPTRSEILACRHNVMEEVRRFRPKLILLLGKSAVDSYLTPRSPGVTDPGMNGWRGWVIPDWEVGAWVAPMFHPAFVLREGYYGVEEVIFRSDMNQALVHLDRPVPDYSDLPTRVEAVTEGRMIRAFLRDVVKRKGTLLTFDYETTGLKPHRKGHRILCCSMCMDFDKSYAFPVDESLFPLMRRILGDPEIYKNAANRNFEEQWSRTILGTRVEGWYGDTVIQAHILNNATGITSVKFQSLVRFGVFNYSDEMKSYMVPSPEESSQYGENAFNRLDQAPMDRLLQYCGMDGLLEHRLLFEQRKEQELTIC
jgi:uracil-DNA glycosylase